jgi:hypothetical protein
VLPQLNNPLLDFSGLPRFADIAPEHVTPAIELLLTDARSTVKIAENAAPTWEAFIAPLEDANERLGRAWGQVAHLHAVMDSPELRAVYNANLPKVTKYWTELGQNEQLFAKYKALHASAEFAALSPAISASAAPSCRPRRRSATPRSRRSSRAFPRSFRRTCSTPLTLFRFTLQRNRSQAFRRTCFKRRAKPPRRTARKGGSSRCTCPPTCR